MKVNGVTKLKGKSNAKVFFNTISKLFNSPIEGVPHNNHYNKLKQQPSLCAINKLLLNSPCSIKVIKEANKASSSKPKCIIKKTSCMTPPNEMIKSSFSLNSSLHKSGKMWKANVSQSGVQQEKISKPDLLQEATRNLVLPIKLLEKNLNRMTIRSQCEKRSHKSPRIFLRNNSDCLESKFHTKTLLIPTKFTLKIPNKFKPSLNVPQLDFLQRHASTAEFSTRSKCKWYDKCPRMMINKYYFNNFSSSSLKNRLGTHFTLSQIYDAKDASDTNIAFADKLQLQLHKSLLSGALDTPRCPTAASVTQRPESPQTKAASLKQLSFSSFRKVSKRFTR